jgi:hypothetical protein
MPWMPPGSSKQHGLIGYDFDGHERFHILEGEEVLDARRCI